MIVIGVRSYLCFCPQPIPQDPVCGDRGVEDDDQKERVVSYLEDEIEEVRSYISEPFFQTIDCNQGWHQLVVDVIVSLV